MLVQAKTLPLDHGGARPDGPVAHRLGQDRRLRHPVRERRRRRRATRPCRRSCCCRRASWRCRSPPSWRASPRTRAIVVVPVYGGAPMGRQVEMLSAGGQIVCGTPGRVLDHLRRGTLKLDRVQVRGARRVRRDAVDGLPGGHRGDPRAHARRRGRRCCSRRRCPRASSACRGASCATREFLKLSADFVGVHEIKHVYYSIPGVDRENELLRILDFEDPKTAIIFCNTREETSRVAEFLRKAGLRRRGDLVGPVAERSRAGHGAHARGRHQVPGRHRRRGARHRHREPVARHQLHLPRGAGDLHPPHRPHRARRQARHGDLADRADRGRLVLLPEAALQDPAGRARAAVGGRDPLAPRGRARADAARGAGRRSGQRVEGPGAAADERGRRRAAGRGAAGARRSPTSRACRRRRKPAPVAIAAAPAPRESAGRSREREREPDAARAGSRPRSRRLRRSSSRGGRPLARRLRSRAARPSAASERERGERASDPARDRSARPSERRPRARRSGREARAARGASLRHAAPRRRRPRRSSGRSGARSARRPRPAPTSPPTRPPRTPRPRASPARRSRFGDAARRGCRRRPRQRGAPLPEPGSQGRRERAADPRPHRDPRGLASRSRRWTS